MTINIITRQHIGRDITFKNFNRIYFIIFLNLNIPANSAPDLVWGKRVLSGIFFFCFGLSKWPRGNIVVC